MLARIRGRREICNSIKIALLRVSIALPIFVSKSMPLSSANSTTVLMASSNFARPPTAATARESRIDSIAKITLPAPVQLPPAPFGRAGSMQLKCPRQCRASEDPWVETRWKHARPHSPSQVADTTRVARLNCARPRALHEDVGCHNALQPGGYLRFRSARQSSQTPK